LVLYSEEPVAALDLTVSGGVEWSSELSLFSRKSRGGRTIFYSLMGDVLSPGRTVLGTVGGTVTAVRLASPDGNLIAAAIVADGETTAVRSVGSDQIVAHGTETTYDLQGRRVSGTMRKGVYVINGKKVVK
jgi:YD repeat-containing protein